MSVLSIAPIATKCRTPGTTVYCAYGYTAAVKVGGALCSLYQLMVSSQWAGRQVPGVCILYYKIYNTGLYTWYIQLYMYTRVQYIWAAYF